MAFVLDRMVSRPNSMNARLTSGRYFVRYVVIDDQTQRRSICAALNQWIVSSAEKATGIGSHFATSLELTPATEYVPQPDDRQQSLFAGTAGPDVATAASAACPEPGQRVPRSEASGSRTELGFSSRILTDGPAAKFRSRHQHSLSIPIPLRFLAGRLWVAQRFRSCDQPFFGKRLGRARILSCRVGTSEKSTTFSRAVTRTR